MKKVLAIILAACMLILFVGCDVSNNLRDSGDDDRGNNRDNLIEDDNDNEDSDEIASADFNVDDVVFSSDFSDGVAIINLKDKDDKAYVINKEGKILFDFPIAENQTGFSFEWMSFSSGLLVYNGKCYDTEGNITTAESLGATSIVAIERGKYIIVEKITSTYNSAKKELGVLNTDFEWLVQFSENNYKLYNSNSTKDKEAFWNEIVRPADPEYQESKEFKDEIGLYKITDFVNGKAAATIWNSESSEMYLTLIDENGDFIFEPVKTSISDLSSARCPLYFDGEHIVLANKSLFGSGNAASIMKIYTYNISGEKTGEFTPDDHIDTWSGTFDYSDGVFVFRLKSGQYSDYYRQSRVKYYGVDFKPLFK